jgi:hypothetical protein
MLIGYEFLWAYVIIINGLSNVGLSKFVLCLDVGTLALGSQPKQRVTRLRAKRETREHFTCSRECKECEGMNPHTPK